MPVTTGNLYIDIGDTSVVFMPDPVPNLMLTAPFETAMPGDTIHGTVDMFSFATMPTDFDTGLYTLTLAVRPVPPSPVHLTFTDPTKFEAFATVYLLATFNYEGDNGCGADCGDVLAEFDSIPGIENCATVAGISTCELIGQFYMYGNYTNGRTSGVTSLYDVQISAIPEPSSILLTAIGAAALLLRRRL
jgi:hypothetical protein